MDPRTEDGERMGMSRYCDYLEQRIAELETFVREAARRADAALDDAKSSGRSALRQIAEEAKRIVKT